MVALAGGEQEAKPTPGVEPRALGELSMRLTGKKKWLSAAAGGVALGVAGTAAFAYFTSTRTGTGAASVGSSSNVTIDQVTSLNPMYPGSGPQGIDLKVTNPGTGTEHVGTVTI